MSQRKGVVLKRILDTRHVRRIAADFSWLDRRFVRDGWIDRLALEESALYFFLVAVADKDGLSFYSDGRIATTLKLDRESVARGRSRLVELGLLAWESPLYQVLEIPASIGEGRLRSGR
jgi:hypothetical protein